MAAFWILAVLWFYGTISLNEELASFESLGTAIRGMRIPVVGMDLTPALLISFFALVAGLGLLHRWQNKPKNADFLIETESELRRVTWPSLDEAINGSLVVIACVLFLMFFLAATDYMLGRLTRTILFGGG